MRRSVRLAENQEKRKNDAQRKPGAKKKRTDNITSNIATLDNETMVESFKYLKYMQLAKTSLVSKRFYNLIGTNRHRLALLYVENINMIDCILNPTSIKMFGREFFRGEYKKWVIRNRYSKQITLKDPVAVMRSKQYGGQVYEMRADYKYSKCSNARTTVLNARVRLKNYNWPLFQHFVRLLTAPFIHINYLSLTPRTDISFMNLLAGAMNPDSNRLRCGTLVLLSHYHRTNIEDNVQKCIGWIKNYVLCKEFRFSYVSDTNFDKEMLDFLMSGAHCTSAISINRSDNSNVIAAFLQKFMDLKECDENEMVESIQCYGTGRVVEVLKRDYAKFSVKEEKGEDQGHNSTAKVLFELINNRIGKKLQIIASIVVECLVCFALDIKNL
ncbi:hypothetical protein DdX_19271 [Ditylenchus destructor]|uniref:F-box domain-containing protein n=1 Tax=Ditylenchus destructor TaxID=166010 RepID=A0AAD4MIR9_9BILA|nr:hypothetical protein DdX_19271 [Ditylenchus destructor]